MAWYFDKITHGFPNSLVFGERGSKDCKLPPASQLVELTDSEYAILSEGIARGLVVKPGVNGKPILADQEPNPPATTEDVNESRLRAYSNPLTGSDQLFSEASRMQIMGEDGYESVLARAIARYSEIKDQYPWPNK